MQIRLRTFNPGERAFGAETVEAPSLSHAQSLAQARGLVVVGAEAVGPVTRPAFRKRPIGDLGWWCRELRTLLAAGMTVVEALDTIALQESAGSGSRTQQLVEKLQQGMTLSEAMNTAEDFPMLLVAGVRAGERSGGLMEAVDDFLAYHEVVTALRRKLVSAAIYPVTVLGIGLLIASMLLAVVMPRFAKLYGELKGGQMDGAPWTLQVSAWLAEHGGLLVLSGGFVSLTAALLIHRKGAAYVWEHLFAVWPVVRRRTDQFLHAKLFRALALILRGGYPLSEALQVCNLLGLGERLNAQVHEAAEAVQQGQRVSEAFWRSGLADETTRRLLGVAERTGALADVLAVVGQRHADQFELFMTRMAKLAEPAMLLLVAALVGGLVLLMYLPIFEMANLVGS